MHSILLNISAKTRRIITLPALRAAVAADPSVASVVVVTDPHAVEDTFRQDWASKARDALDLPVLHLYRGTSMLG